jgi:hypothetical protein
MGRKVDFMLDRPLDKLLRLRPVWRALAVKC